MTVAGLSLISIAVDLALPKGKLKPIAQFVLGLMVMLSLIEPVFGALAGLAERAEEMKLSLLTVGSGASVEAYASLPLQTFAAEAVAEETAIRAGARRVKATAKVDDAGVIELVRVQCDLTGSACGELERCLSEYFPGTQVDVVPF